MNLRLTVFQEMLPCCITADAILTVIALPSAIPIKRMEYSGRKMCIRNRLINSEEHVNAGKCEEVQGLSVRSRRSFITCQMTGCYIHSWKTLRSHRG
jgi:hypothetical protein